MKHLWKCRAVRWTAKGTVLIFSAVMAVHAGSRVAGVITVMGNDVVLEENYGEQAVRENYLYSQESAWGTGEHKIETAGIKHYGDIDTVSKKQEKEKQKKTEKENGQTCFLTEEDYQVLLRIVEAEATGEDIYGKMLVANVVLNRVRDERFPDTVKEVVFQNSNGVYQFSPIADGRYESVTISDTTREAVRTVVEKGWDESGGALYFMARQVAEVSSSGWFDQSLTFVMQYGGHEFFR